MMGCATGDAASARHRGDSVMKVGFIGLGSMGLPMAQRILATGGHELTIYARREATLEPFKATAAAVAATPAELGAAVETVGICVFDAAGVEEVMFGPHGLAETLAPGSVVLVHSTVSSDQIRTIAATAATHDLRVLDAPVSGGAPKAIDGELTIMVGGDKAAMAEVAPLLETLSNHVVHLGDVGAGSHAKLINNTMFSAQVALAEDAMRAGETLGLDLRGLGDILLTSSSACIASGLRIRCGSMRGIAGTEADQTLVKDVTLTASLIGDSPGKELVDVAQRFVAEMKAARAAGG
jgi:3-hydroxyisobutyrate dehydrogenase-like beta-hydroxyacid dehydrogenase